MLGPGVDVKSEPSLEGLKDIVLGMDDEVVYAEDACDGGGRDVQKFGVAGDDDEVILDDVAAPELDGVETVLVGHAPMIEEVGDGDGVDNAVLDGVERGEDSVGNAEAEGVPQGGGAQSGDGVVPAIDKLEDSVEGVVVGVG